MKLKIISIISNAIDFVMIFIILLLFYLIQPILTNRVIFIPNGSINYIIKKLQNNNIDVLQFDKYFLRVLGYPQSGWIDLKSTQMTKLDFLHKLTISKAVVIPITIIPAETPYFLYKNLSKKLDLNFYKLKQECNSKEYEFIYPDTYYLPLGISEKGVCNYLINYSLKIHKKIAFKIFDKFNKKKYKNYLIIGSIIEKEAANKQEMPIIASVIYNRLKNGMKLQMDGTLNYGKYSHIKITPYRIKNDRTQFNTYKYFGIPNRIIGFVGKSALKSAIFPKSTKYLYFVKVGKTHKFSTTYKEHLKSVKK